VAAGSRAGTPRFSHLADEAAIGCPVAQGQSNSDWVRTMAESRARKAGLGPRARAPGSGLSGDVRDARLLVFSLAGSVAHARVSGSRTTTANASTARGACGLGHGVKHVIELSFDNVHFFRDNPNVPSDLELMPNLLNFIEHNGTMMSNNHTPLIAHTADDILTTLTGLYGDRQSMPISNSYRTYNPDGTTDPAGSFAYWTDPVFDTASTPSPGHDTNPSMVYSATPPATTFPAPAPNTTTPAPWVPFTRARCDVGAVGTANIELENTAVDIPKVFGLTRSAATRRRLRQLQGHRDRRLCRGRGALRPRKHTLQLGASGEVRPDQSVALGGAGPASRRTERIHGLQRPVRPPVRGSPARRRDP
jgi:hypothetical protein